MADSTATLPPALPETALCLNCGYSLRDLPENRCPECSTAFDPADPLTWKDSAAPGAWKRHVLECAQPAGRLEIMATIIMTIILLALAPTRASNGLSREYLPTVGLVFLTPVLLLRGTYQRMAARMSPGVSATRPSRLQRLYMPACLVALAIGAIAMLLPDPARPSPLQASYPELMPMVAAMQAGTPPRAPCVIGSHKFLRIARLADGRVKFEYEPGNALVYDPRHIMGPQDWSEMHWGR